MSGRKNLLFTCLFLRNEFNEFNEFNAPKTSFVCVLTCMCIGSQRLVICLMGFAALAVLKHDINWTNNVASWNETFTRKTDWSDRNDEDVAPTRGGRDAAAVSVLCVSCRCEGAADTLTFTYCSLYSCMHAASSPAEGHRLPSWQGIRFFRSAVVLWSLRSVQAA